jgi:uncharacterized GH25 family protein
MMKKLLLSISFITALFFGVQAHEFWLAVEKFALKVGENVSISFLVGEDFAGETWQGKMASFYLYSAKGKISIAELFPTKPEDKTELSFKEEGTHLLAFNSQNKFLELEPDKFLAYLEEDGLSEIIKLRQERKETDKKGRELYQRCAKTLLQVGKKTDEIHKTKVGHTLEIIPEQNPYTLQDKSPLQFKVLFKKKPLPNQIIKVWRKKEGKLLSKTDIKTDEQGMISITLEKQGDYMISTVKMIPHPKPTEADWQSYWGSLVFGF